MSIDKMYTELIMTHNRSGHNKHVLESANYIERGHNPNCGDDLALSLRIKDGLIDDAAFTGSGCAISQASMSIMIDLVKGKSLDETKQLAEDFLDMVRGVKLDASRIEHLEDAQIFESLSKMPARVKCGTLGWHCLSVILDKSTK
ncbi:MAG TPA: SUF system NifU family Fe-S cluster assembly protein [Clostridiales bacterium UBA8960]|jgi:nitrogen fixation NifU-like protein|nr:SUF system NifU family Fe-S cluster assembly protein [Clostridiales bacterium UBA8960]